MSYLTSKAMQTTAIGTVANSLPENKVILITLLNSSRYIPYTDLRKINATHNFCLHFVGRLPIPFSEKTVSLLGKQCFPGDKTLLFIV